MPEFVPQNEPAKAAPVSKPLEGGVSIPVSPQVIQRKELEGYIQRRKDEQMEKYFPGGIPAQVPPIPWDQSPQAQAAAAMPAIQMKAAPATTTNSDKVIQKKDPEVTYVTKYVVVDHEVDQEGFKILALQSLFGGTPPTSVKWTLTKTSFGPADSPVPVRVDIRLIKGQRSQNNAAKGIGVADDGGVEGAKERAKSFGSGPNTKDKAALMAEIDRRYYEAMGVPPGEKITNSAADKGKAELWKQIRDEVLFQNEYLRNLPPQVQKIIKISTDGKVITPDEIEQLFRIAKSIEAMSPALVSDYASKINSSTTDLSKLEESVNRFIQQSLERENSKRDREKIQTKLYGLEELYKAYKTWKTMQGINIPSYGGGDGVRDPNADRLREQKDRNNREFLASLQAHGFSGVVEFEKYITDYELAFQKEAVQITLDILGKYEGLLYREGERYKDQKVVDALHQQLSGFRTQYSEFKRNADISNDYAENSERSRLPGNGHLRPKATREEADNAYQKASVAKASAVTEVKNLSGAHPLFNEDHLPLDRRLDKEKMAQASPGELRQLIQDHVAARIKDVQKARQDILGDPDCIFKIDRLMPEFKARQGVAKGSICDQIINDKIAAIHRSETFLSIILAVLAIALAIVSFGTATPFIAAAAAVGGLAISSYMAFEEYQKYTFEHDLAAVGFADDPSMFWLVVSVVAVVVDMGIAVKALKALGPAAKAFNATGDAAEFAKVVKILEESGEIDAKIAAAANRASAAKKGFQQASGELSKVLGSKLYAFPGPLVDPDVYRVLVKMASEKIKDIAATFEQFVLEIKNARKLAKLGEMTPEELAKVKQAWEEAKILADSAKTPINIINPQSGKVFGTFSQGNQMEIISKGSKLHGGNVIKLNPNATTTVTGSLNDVNAIALRGEQLAGSTLSGANQGGINILRSPKWFEIQDKYKHLKDGAENLKYWKAVTDEFWETVNKPWLEAAIQRGDNIRMVSNPASETALHVTKEKSTELLLDAAGNKIRSIFGREVDLLAENGYKFLPDGSAVKAP